MIPVSNNKKIEKESGARIQEPGEIIGIVEDWNIGMME
jgi:hypothetical protein